MGHQYEQQQRQGRTEQQQTRMPSERTMSGSQGASSGQQPMGGGQQSMSGGQQPQPMSGGQQPMASGQQPQSMGGGQQPMAGGQQPQSMSGGQQPMAGGQQPSGQAMAGQEAQSQQSFENHLTNELRIALEDFTELSHIADWCAKMCASEGPQLATCAAICRDIAELAEFNEKLIARDSMFGPEIADTFVRIAEESLPNSGSSSNTRTSPRRSRRSIGRWTPV